MPSLLKPAACTGCPLADKGEGFAHPEGPQHADMLLVGEALGVAEAKTGRPFVGDAGGMLQRLLNLLGWSRDALRIHNTINCHPPNDWFDERAPWYWGALKHCQYLDDSLNDRPKVVVTLGATALKRVLGLTHLKKIRVNEWHGTITRDPFDRFWVVPTFHPSFLQRGAHNLIGTVLWDLTQAEKARDFGKPTDPGTLVIDPPAEWFHAWIEQVIAARAQDPLAYPISVDIETPDKAHGRDEGEITTEDRSYQILRVNVAAHPDEGITVPYVGPYLAELQRLLGSPGPQWYWNREYDFGRLVHAGQLREEQSPSCVDLMWLWHFLQSDLPRGLGFAAPFYSSWGPWKHLADADPARYAAIDSLQTHRIGFGVLRDLQATGQFHYAMRHTHELHTRVLRPAQLIGVRIDRPQLLVFKQELADKARALLGTIQTCVPEALAPLTPKDGLTRAPAADLLHAKASAFTRKGKPRAGKPIAEIKQELYARARVIEKLLIREVLACQTCGAIEIQRRHKCPKGEDGAPRTAAVQLVTATVKRWFWQEPFNPDSPKQILAYMKAKGHKPGKAKKSAVEESTNREALERLERTGDPFYRAVLDYRAVNKVKGTYVEGTERRLDEHDRLHPVPTFKPSTMRLSYVDPNITNVVADKGGKEGLAAGFRRCVVAGSERPVWLTAEAYALWAQKWNLPAGPPDYRCKLLETDFASIEAVLVGERAGDREYYRLGRLGVHAALASHVLGRPYDPAWLDDQLAAYFAEIKDHEREVYEPSKRFVHGRSYGLTVPGMCRQFPHLFPSEAAALRYARTFAKMAPKVETYQHTTQDRAARQHYLGGPGGHPFTYKHWFWSIYTYRRLNASQYFRIVAKAQRDGLPPPVTEINGQYFRIGAGEDSKRALAFDGQSIASGILKEAMLRLYADPSSPSCIADAYFGRTPLRAPIHDSLLNEIPLLVWDRVTALVAQEMQRPVPELPLPAEWGFGDHVAIGVAAKAGWNWDAMEKIAVPGFVEGIEALAVEPMESEDQDDWADLGRAV